MSRPRIIVTTPDFPPATGGIQRLLGELVSHATGWNIRVVTLDHAGARAVPSLASTRHVTINAFRRSTIARLNLATVREGLLWRPDAIVSGHVITSPGALLLGRLLRVPTVQYVYAKELSERPRLVRTAMGWSTATVVLSGHASRLAQQSGADPLRTHVVPPGVNVPAGSVHGAMKSDVPTILTVARLADRYKGFDLMLRAMPLVCARVPKARWVVVGEGPLRDELERTVRAWGLSDSVRFCGQVSEEELDCWFERSHVFAMPSRIPADGGGEGYGLVYLEAGARGLPCVAGNRGAVAEVVIHGETGLLVDATDHAQTAAALVDLLADADRAAALGAAGRERARMHSWGAMAAKVEALVAELMTPA